jgi:hypothetical protein
VADAWGTAYGTLSGYMPATWARRLIKIRMFARYLQQFEPNTEVPDDTNRRLPRIIGFPMSSSFRLVYC